MYCVIIFINNNDNNRLYVMTVTSSKNFDGGGTTNSGEILNGSGGYDDRTCLTRWLHDVSKQTRPFQTDIYGLKSVARLCRDNNVVAETLKIAI
ncbi:unnamed protein product [Lupinus luteus]|uniref:Uncharacterized protein n=1 Tax=Lupinus luteus TaxID=3873 RepID=A0AAV1WU85_LUPLU